MPRSLIAALLAVALTAPAAAQPAPPVQVSGQTSPWLLSKVIGLTVYNGQNENIGTLTDLVMDPKARVITAIISVGGYLGVGDRLVEVPLSTLRFPHEPTTTGSASNFAESGRHPAKAVLGVTKGALMALPPFQP